MKVGRDGQQHHLWSPTYTLSWVKLLLDVCSTKPICVWFTEMFLMDIWSLFVNISLCIQQGFPFGVFRVTGFWTTCGFNRVRVNLGCSMVIQDKKTVIYSTESHFEEFEWNKSRQSHRGMGCSLMYKPLNCNCACCPHPLCRLLDASLPQKLSQFFLALIN